MATTNYCVFIDVLGYKGIVNDVSKTVDERVNILNNIYSNLASSLLIHINEINKSILDKIFIKSFSDCFYLESTNLLALLYACEKIYNDTFGFNVNLPDNYEYTPLIRGGLVKDWTVRFKDLGSMVNNEQGVNPVGLGVARAYYTSEKSLLSGMRLIISPEVIDDLVLKAYSRNGFSCFSHDFIYNSVNLPFYFNKISYNEDNKPVDLYELIWPEEVMSSCTYEYVTQLRKIRKNFPTEHIRHWKKTAEIILNGLLISSCDHRTENVFEKYKNELMEMIK